ncbi:MAG TPA: hypothetical protein ENK63_00135 [Rhodobacterales bacterium]|nr:hypothetical protein [Rhodobacterales bacterium]
MTFLLLSIALAGATVFVARPAFVSDPRVPVAFGDSRALVAVFPAYLAITLLIGLDFALAAMLALALRELGQVVGYRLAGHDDAQFRLIPLPGGPRASARAPDSTLAAAFILLMGAGFGLAPMVAGAALGEAAGEMAPALAQTARTYALAAGAVNFVLLLPIWPLPGGQFLRLAIEARAPRLGGPGAALLAAFVIGLSLSLHSISLLLIGGIGALALIAAKDTPPARARLGKGSLWLAMSAYLATLAAYALAGAWVIWLIPVVG